MLRSPQFQETEVIYDGQRTIVYRAIQRTDQQPVIVKALRNPYPHFNELVQFRNQFVIASKLDFPHIVCPIALERYENGHILIMPDQGAIALSEYWQGHFGCEPHQGNDADSAIAFAQHKYKQFLKIAIQLASALDYLGREKIVHKDIKPANILIHPNTGDVQLIDFSISSLLPKEQQRPIPPTSLEGTLAYIAPEQTGRMNRGIDYRTDFYSLGVTLYELLTGTLPFIANDPLELLHCHIAKAPTAPADLLGDRGQPDPLMLSAIVMKLMAKNAEDRYQSALGLRHDLEQCLQSLEATGEIETFELGGRDICDRFLIPERLYGRVGEVKRLLNAFDRVAKGTSEMLLVAGFSGIGKTAVINEVHKPIVGQRGYFIKGKFDQFNRNIPFSALIQAFRELMGQLLSESDIDLASWRMNILEAVGQNGQVLIDVIPELQQVIGEQPDVPKLSGTAIQNRFNILFQKFIAVFTTPEHPLVVFLDDLQWADSASLSLIKVLMTKGSQKHLLLLGAYRDNEVFPAHPLMLTLGDLERDCASLSTITLSPLPITDINQLVAETLHCASELASPLTELIYQKTQGNPFFTTQFLVGLYEDDLIVFDRDLGYWECDLVQVRDAALTDDVVEFMVRRLQKLTEVTQDVLKLAACIGNQFDLATLAIVCQADPEAIATDLWPALQEELIVPTTEAYKFFQGESERGENLVETVSYRFLHDRIQQAAYRLIPTEQRQTTHHRIGHRLLDQTLDPKISPRLFEITNHLNQAQDLLASVAEHWELVQLNLYASQAARAGTAYQATFNYLDQALKLLPDQGWEDNYELTLTLYQEGASAALLVGKFKRLEQWIGVALNHAQIVLDCVPCYEVQIQALVAQKQLPEAIQLGIDTLEKLGVSFSSTSQPEAFIQSITAIADLLGDREIEDLLALPAMDDPHSIAILRVLFRLSAVLVLAAPQVMPFCMFKAVELSITLGNSVLSAPAYTTYGMILCGAVGDVATGYRFGQLGLQVIERFQGKALQAKTLVRFQAGVRHWQDPLRDTLNPLGQGYQLGLEVGDLESAAICAEVYGYHAYFAGEELTQLEVSLKTYSQGIQAIQQQTMLVWNESCRQQVLNLLGQSDDPTYLMGDAYDETVNLPQQQAYQDGFGLGMVYLHKSMACYLFEQPEIAIEHLHTAAQFLSSFASFAAAPVFHFYTVLAHLATLPMSETCDAIEWSPPVEKSYAQLQSAARSAPTNYQHKLELVMAERYRVLGQRHDAEDAYDRAIAGAKANQYIQEEALAGELAAKFYLTRGKEKIAAVYLQEAYYCYAHWGAKAKTKHLEANYPALLTPILEKRSADPNTFDSIASFTRTLATTLQSPTQSSTKISTALDFSSVLQAAQKLTSTIKLDQLLSDIVEIVMTNAGAKKMALLTAHDSQWQIQATAEQTDEGKLLTQIQTQPLNSDSPLPVRLIQYVKNTQTSVLISEVETELTGILEGYLLKYQPQSVLCVPLLNQGSLVAIAYLEHATTKGVFTPHCQTIVKFLCAQAAIALKNAYLYEQEQQKSADLKLSEQRFKTMFDNAADAFTILSDQGFIAANQSCANLFGFADKKSLISLHPGQLSPEFQPDGQSSFDKANSMVQMAHEKGCHKFEWIHEKCDGTPFWAEVMLTPIPYADSTGEIINCIHAIVRDISDRKRAEEAIINKSKMLEQTLEELQQAQLQLVQGEKMSALGNLVAGVAHEINNPVGFLKGNIEPAQEYIQELFQLIELYQRKLEDPNVSIESDLEDIDFDFIQEDLPKLINSMNSGVDRIRDISNSLRTFSRKDQEQKTAFNLHDGIDSTLLILKHRTKANEHRPEIGVIKDYGDLLEIQCFPGQLNQVFMNVLANAIDAFEESNQGKTYAEIEGNPNTINIQTLVLGNQVEIRIQDNGCGMDPETAARIFEQGFTTKDVGKGTGLGMAIAHQIITEKHKGTITCTSDVGQGTTFKIALPL